MKAPITTTTQRPETDADIEADFASRLATYNSFCGVVSKGEVEEVYYHEPSHLSVCHAPKVCKDHENLRS